MNDTAAFDLTLDAVTQRYRGAPSAAVDQVTLEVAAGELVALLGPSGCGKTTLLRIIAGFVQQTSGRVVIGGRPVDDLPPNRREIGVVFQNYALFPHMTAADNVGYGLAARGVGRDARIAKAKEMLELVQMTHLAERLPREMSGGQQQRVALARALAVGPRILLLDEPFGALDKSLRLDMQIEVKRLQRHAGITCIMVTHDQEEALSMADRVAVVHQGRLEQFAPPNEVYDRPRTLFVNQFVGASNSLDARLVGDGGTWRARIAGAPAWPIRLVGDAGDGDPVIVCVRPEHLRRVGVGEGLPGTIELSLPLGPQIVHEIRLGDGQAVKVVESRSHGAQLLPPGQAVNLALAEGAQPNAFPRPQETTS